MQDDAQVDGASVLLDATCRSWSTGRLGTVVESTMNRRRSRHHAAAAHAKRGLAQGLRPT